MSGLYVRNLVALVAVLAGSIPDERFNLCIILDILDTFYLFILLFFLVGSTKLQFYIYFLVSDRPGANWALLSTSGKVVMRLLWENLKAILRLGHQKIMSSEQPSVLPCEADCDSTGNVNANGLTTK